MANTIAQTNLEIRQPYRVNTYLNIFRKFYGRVTTPIFLTCTTLIRHSWFLIQTVIRTITRLASYFVNPYTCTNDPIKDVREFKTEFNKKYSENHYDFFTGTYGAALTKAKREIRFLLVYLHSPLHLDTDVFCREILSSDLVTCLLVQYNVLLWGVSVRSLEGKRVSRILRENTYPFMALILSHNHHMEVVHRFEGNENREVFVDRLRMVLEQQENYLVVTRNEIQTLNQNRQLRDEQDREYQDSMATDIERKRKQQEEKEDQLREELEFGKIQEEAKLKRADTERRKSELVRYFSENQTDGTDSIEIRFKFPNDKPVSNRFLQDHPVSRLYNFVFSSENSPDNFQIAMNLPRKVLDVNNGSLTLKDVGITKSCTLFVEDLDT